MFNESKQSLAMKNKLGAPNNMGSAQNLILNTYVEEKTKWEKKRIKLQNKFDNKTKKLDKAYSIKIKESRFKKFFYHKIIKKMTPAERKYEDINRELDKISKRIKNHDSMKPKDVPYILASFNNNLFKPPG